MTREEAIEILKAYRSKLSNSVSNQLDGDIKAFNIAINSLEIDERYELEYEQIEPCEDAISRQAVLDYIYNDLGLGDEENGKDLERQTELDSFYRYIKSLPPVTPQETVTEFADRCKECGAKYSRLLKQKTGRWIAQDIHNCHTAFKCSKCGYIYSFTHLYGKPKADYSYCPNCGAKMEGGQNGK